MSPTGNREHSFVRRSHFQSCRSLSQFSNFEISRCLGETPIRTFIVIAKDTSSILFTRNLFLIKKANRYNFFPSELSYRSFENINNRMWNIYPVIFKLIMVHFRGYGFKKKRRRERKIETHKRLEKKLSVSFNKYLFIYYLV